VIAPLAPASRSTRSSLDGARVVEADLAAGVAGEQGGGRAAGPGLTQHPQPEDGPVATWKGLAVALSR
jgi:hypothetical protein